MSATSVYRAKAKRDGRRLRPQKTGPKPKRNTAVLTLHAAPVGVVLESKAGLLGHPGRGMLSVSAMDLVAALDDNQIAAETMVKFGTCALVALLRYPLGTQGTSIMGLLEKLAAHAGVDVPALRVMAAKEELERQAADGEAEVARQAALKDAAGSVDAPVEPEQLELPL